MTSRLRGSRKNSRMLSATLGPTSSTSSSSASLASASLSSEAKWSAKSWPVRSPTKRMPKAKISRRQARLLAVLDFLQQIARRLVPHPLQVRQLLVGQTVEIRNVVDQSLVHQLVHQGFSQAIDIHGAATGEIEQRLSKPGAGKPS